MACKAVRWLGGIGLAAVLIGITACAVSAPTASLSTGTESSNTDNLTSNTNKILDSHSSQFPLDNYLNLVWGTGFSQEEILRREGAELQRLNELLAECLHDAGFESDLQAYGMQFFPATAIPEFETFPNDRDWVAQWGYGIVSAEQLGGGQRGVAHELPPSPYSPAEQEAFRQALFNFPIKEDGEQWHRPLDWTSEQYRELGCFPWARHILLEETPLGLPSANEFIPLFEAIEEMQSAWQRDNSPEEIEWAACMADNHFPGFERRTDPDSYSDRSFPEQQIDAAWLEILSIPALPGGHAVGVDPAATALLEREITMALADLDCRTAVNFDARLDARRIAAETQFVADHRTELEGLRAAAEQRS